MSAYLVDRTHIIFLIKALLDKYENGPYLKYDDLPDNPVELCEILRTENVKSINARYPDTVENPEEAPGDASLALLPFTSEEYEKTKFSSFKAAQVYKSCSCYRYQACEHNGWPESKAYKIIEKLIDDAARCMSEELEKDLCWGAPDPVK